MQNKRLGTIMSTLIRNISIIGGQRDTDMVDIRIIAHQLIEYMETALEDEDLHGFGSNSTVVYYDLSTGVNREFIIIGWIFKSLSADLYLIKRLDIEKNLPKVLKEIRSSINKMNEHIDADPINIAPFWEVYFEIKNIIRNSIFTEKERKALKIHPEFSKEISIELINFLDKNRRLLLNKSNKLIPGILNENYRTSHMYGGKEALVFSLVLLALDRYYDGFRYELELEESLDKKVLLYDTKMDKYIKSLCELRQKAVSGKIDDLYDCANAVLINLGLDCRSLFLRYGENPNEEEKTVNQKIDLPESAKKKISDAIAKSLDKELR